MGILWLKNQVIFLRFAHFNTNFFVHMVSWSYKQGSLFTFGENKVFPFMVVQVTILFLTRQKHNVYSSYLVLIRPVRAGGSIQTSELSLFSKECEIFASTRHIFACALKLSICTKGAMLFAHKACTYLIRLELTWYYRLGLIQYLFSCNRLPDDLSSSYADVFCIDFVSIIGEVPFKEVGSAYHWEVQQDSRWG